MGEIINADAFEGLRTLPDCSVDCCVTSPPYYGLRDYGVDGQIGLENTAQEYIVRLVEVFREVRRVLKNDGTLWLNIGDTYAGSGRGHSVKPNKQQKASVVSGLSGVVPDGCKPKDLIGIPWTLAFALREDGWYLRQEIIWAKPNPMPESVSDRCTKSHESIFLFSKKPHYHYDAEAIKEDAITSMEREDVKRGGFSGKRHKHSEIKHISDSFRAIRERRNKRDVWTVSTKPYKGAHFAVFPEELIKPCILAGCPLGGTVLDPFGGSGTTAKVAIELGRDYVLTELNPEYCDIAQKRIQPLLDQGRLAI